MSTLTGADHFLFTMKVDRQVKLIHRVKKRTGHTIHKYPNPHITSWSISLS